MSRAIELAEKYFYDLSNLFRPGELEGFYKQVRKETLLEAATIVENCLNGEDRWPELVLKKMAEEVE